MTNIAKYRRTRISRCFGLAAVVLLLAGCMSRVDYHRTTPDDTAENATTGMRYYESAPYVLIYSDGQGGLFWQIYYLPDQTRMMAATPKVKGGKAQMTMTFTNGTLASGGATGDTTTIPNAVVASVQAVIPFLAAGGLAAAATAPATRTASGEKSTETHPTAPRQLGFPAPLLYKIVVEPGDVHFIGGPGTGGDIRVPLVNGLVSP